MGVLSQAELEKRLTVQARLTADVKDTATARRVVQGIPEPADTGRASITVVTRTLAGVQPKR